MLTMEELTHTMLDLAECKFTPTQWTDWWNLHEADVEVLLNRGEYLHIKPKQWGGERIIWRTVYMSQRGAFRYLQKRCLPFQSSSCYCDKWNEEFEEYCKAEKRKQKEQLLALKIQFPQLFQRYPKFANSLGYTYSSSDRIGPGLTDSEIVLWEAQRSIQLPEDVKLFFQTCNPLLLEGIQLAINEIATLVINKKHWFVLGEFWKDADGDLLLFQLGTERSTTIIYYYAHEMNKVRKLCSSMKELLENKMSWYNRNQV